MKAAQLVDYGPAENFRLIDVPKPIPGAGEVLIQVHYAGLRWGDIMGRRGIPARSAVPPFVPGQEAAGVVAELGNDVAGFNVGDRVTALPRSGAYAEFLCMNAKERIAKIPANVPTASALAYRVNMPTAYFIVYEWARVQEGEIVLVHAAAGGVGMLVVQILKRRFRNVTVIGLASTEDKCRLAAENGADHVINSERDDYVAEVKKLFGSPRALAPGERAGGIDVVLNGVAGSTLHKDRRVIRRFGRWVLYGSPAGVDAINVYATAYDSITILPFSTIPFKGTPAEERAQRFTDDWMRTEELIRPTVHSLDEIIAVQRAMERRETRGKVVFSVAPGA